MTLWIILTTVLAVVAIGAAVPFLRRAASEEGSEDVAKSSAVFNYQLKQIDAELAAGAINETDAEAMRTEVARRLVLAEREEKAQTWPVPVSDRSYAAIGIAGAITLGSAILYVNIGEPDLMPRHAVGKQMTDNMGTLPPRHPPVVGNAGPSGPTRSPDQSDGQSELATVDQMIERLAQRLRANPEDPDGWRMLGWSYASQGRYAEAAVAYEEASKRQPENAELHAARAEAMVRAGTGQVTSEAAKVFEEALKYDKQNPQARFFLGLRKVQAGKRQEGLDDWIAILKGAPANEPWAVDIRKYVEALAADLKIDVSADLPDPVPAGGPAASTLGLQSGSDGPGILGALQREEAAAQDQGAMIKGMVDGLAARLEKQPDDAQGWARLIRSRVVLGESDKAKAALIKAREVFAGKPDELAMIGALARELAIEP